MGRSLRYGGIVVLTLLVVSIWLTFRTTPQTNLLLITLDTTRADHLGCYGYEPAATPILDQIARRGVLFENAYAVCPVTLPSHTTMFTGLMPREHGIHHNGIGKLDSHIPTLPEVLQSKGYDTAGFVGAFVLNQKFGLNRGFQVYDDFTGGEFANGQFHRRRSGQRVVDAALNWLQGRSSRPFFCWVHLFDPHAPYQTREELFGQQFAARPYDAGIGFCDQQIGRIIDDLDRRGLKDSTLIVIVGDHGEGLGDHDEHEHGHMLYNSTLRVPLILAHPLICKQGHRIAQAVSLVDLAPTLHECLGLKRVEKHFGRSLAAALHGDKLSPRPCSAETQIPFLEHRWAPQDCLITEEWKFIQSPQPELYDLLQDPAELHNLADNRQSVLSQMKSLLVKLQADQQNYLAQNVKLSSAERRSLASLGYLGNVGDQHDSKSDPNHQSLPDIKDRLKYHQAVEDANQLLDLNRPQEALVILENVVAAVPDYLPARMVLGEALAKSGKLDEACQVYQMLAENDPGRGEVHARLGSILGQLGHSDDALAEIQRAVDLGPDTAEYRVSLGVLYLELHQQEKALEQFQRGIRVDPACANFEIGKVLAASGDLNGAVNCYKRTLECDPNWIPLHTEIAVLLARQKKFDEAIEYAKRAVQLSPQDADAHYNLGRMLFEKGKFSDALGPLEEAVRRNPQHPKAPRQLKQVQEAIQRIDNHTSGH